METGRVRTDDVRQLFRLSEECREFHDAGERREHFLVTMARLARAPVAIDGLFVMHGAAPRISEVRDVGWSGPDRNRIYEHIASNPFGHDPLVQSVMERLEGECVVTAARQDAMCTHDWERSELRNELHRPARVDDSLVSVMRGQTAGEIHAVVLKRAWGELAFDAEDRDLLHLAHTELAWIFRAAPASSPWVAAEFSPRERQTLDLLLTGESEKRIAARLGLSGHTVHEYVKTNLSQGRRRQPRGAHGARARPGSPVSRPLSRAAARTQRWRPAAGTLSSPPRLAPGSPTRTAVKPPEAPDPHHVVSSLARREVAVELQTIDVCFLAALHLRAERGALASFTEEQLVDVFDAVLANVAPPDVRATPRGTHAIRRLREQRMLARVDGAGVVRAGEFALTRLATGIVEFFLTDETLTRESLTLLGRSLLAALAEVLAAAGAATGPDAWRDGVAGPLNVTIPDLVAGILRRQRGFDAQQEHLQREIAALLKADWFGAIDQCQTLLDATSTTLRELNEVLMRDGPDLQSTLQELQELASAAGALDVEEATRRLVEQVDRIAAWGAARQHAWSGYYQYVHRFLRDVVRLDPSRVVTHRVRERLASDGSTQLALAVAAAPPMQVLREIVPPPSGKPPVRRPRPDAEAPLAQEPPEDREARLDADVRGAIAAGARGLGDVTARLTGVLPAPERYAAAGRIAHAIARVTRPDARAERPWVPVDSGLQIEEWTLPSCTPSSTREPE